MWKIFSKSSCSLHWALPGPVRSSLGLVPVYSCYCIWKTVPSVDDSVRPRRINPSVDIRGQDSWLPFRALLKVGPARTRTSSRTRHIGGIQWCQMTFYVIFICLSYMHLIFLGNQTSRPNWHLAPWTPRPAWTPRPYRLDTSPHTYWTPRPNQ